MNSIVKTEERSECELMSSNSGFQAPFMVFGCPAGSSTDRVPSIPIK